MTNFNYKKRSLFSGLHLLGTLLTLAGIFALVSPTFMEIGVSMERILTVGIFTTVIGLLIVSFYDGTIIDYTQKRYREYSSIAGIKFGEWTSLPVVTKVKVISKTYISTNTPNGVSPTLSGKVTDHLVFIYSNETKPTFSFGYTSKDKAEMEAKELAAKLDVSLEMNISDS